METCNISTPVILAITIVLIALGCALGCLALGFPLNHVSFGITVGFIIGVVEEFLRTLILVEEDE